MATVSEQTRTSQVNTFTGGLNTDLHPLLQPNDTLTDCLNGTIITYNGNENMLQNDMGNYRLKNAKLPEGYIPMGMKEHQGVLYMVLYNPVVKRIQFGSYPSPQTIFSKNTNVEEYEIQPIEIGILDDTSSENIWNIVDDSENPDNLKYLYTKLDLSKSECIFTGDYSDNSMLGMGDKYLLGIDNISSIETNTPLQEFKFFTMNKDKKSKVLDSGDVELVSHAKVELSENDPEEYNNVNWDNEGWLGAKYEVDKVNSLQQSVDLIVCKPNSNVPIYSIKKSTSVKNIPTEKSMDFVYNFRFHKSVVDGKIFDIENFVKNNTTHVYLFGDIDFDSNVIEYNEDLEGCGTLTIEENTPKYKYDNRLFYLSEEGDVDISRYATRKKNPIKAMLCPAGITKLPEEAKAYYFIGNPSREEVITAVNKEDVTIYLSDRCTFFDNAELLCTVIKSEDEFVNTLYTKEELNKMYEDKFSKVVLHFDDKLTKFGLNGKMTFGNWNSYEINSTDWLESISYLKANTVIYPNIDGLLIDGVNKTIVADHIETIIQSRTDSIDKTFANKITNFYESKREFEFITSITKVESLPYYKLFRYQFDSNFKIEDDSSKFYIKPENEYFIENSDYINWVVVIKSENPTTFAPDYLIKGFWIFSDILLFHCKDNIIEKQEIIKFGKKFSESVDGKYIVPEDFDGTVFGTPINLPDQSIWSEDKKLVEYVLDVEKLMSKLSINFTGHNSNIATRVIIGENTYYLDSSSGNSNLQFYYSGTEDILIESVPFKTSDEYCLIYDGLKISDKITSNNYEKRSVELFQYHCINDESFSSNIYLNVFYAVDVNNVLNSIKLFKVNNGTTTYLKHKIENISSESATYSDSLKFNISTESKELSPFIFLEMDLDSDDSVILPIHPNVSEEKYVELKEVYKNFSDAFFDEIATLPASEEMEYTREVHSQYLCMNSDLSQVWVHREEPFLWHSIIPKLTASSKKCHFGIGTYEDLKINLSELGLTDGTRYSIKIGETYLEKNKEFSSEDTSMQDENGDIVWKHSCLNGYECSEYEYVDQGSGGEFDEITTRDYLLKFAPFPLSINVEEEFGWNKQLCDYANWDTVLESARILYVSKSEGKNPYVKVGTQNAKTLASSSNITYTECTDENQLLIQTKKATTSEDDTTAQFITPVMCSLKTKKNGFILPIPRIGWGMFYKQNNYFKNNTGTQSAGVLTRQTKGLQIDRAIFQAFMALTAAATAVGGVIGGIAISLALGFVAGISAVGMAIPIVGWAVVCAAAIAASIYGIINYVKGEDQEFDFYVLKGKDGKLVLPLWGSSKVKKYGKYPMHINPNPTWVEELMCYLYTRVYYVKGIGYSGTLVKTGNVVKEPLPITLEIFGRTLENKYPFINEYIELTNLLSISTNNFSASNITEQDIVIFNSSESTDDSQTETIEIPSFEDIIESQLKLSHETKGFHYEYVDASESANSSQLNTELQNFVNHLGLNTEDNQQSWVYFDFDGVNTNSQECFGGNRGGCNIDVKVAPPGEFWTRRLMCGEFPSKKDGFLPVAYPVTETSKDTILNKSKTWGKGIYTPEYKQLVYRPTDVANKWFKYITWVLNTKYDEI